MAASRTPGCSHSKTTLASSGTEEITVCVECGLTVPSNKLTMDVFSQGTLRMRSFHGSEFDQKLPSKLKASIGRNVVRSCEVFTLGQHTQTNIRLFLYSIYYSEVGYRPTTKERAAIIAWYIHQECIKEGKTLTLKEICTRLEVRPSLVTKVLKKLKGAGVLQNTAHRCSATPEEIFDTLVCERLGKSTIEEKQRIREFCVRLFRAFAESNGPFTAVRNHCTFQEGIFYIVMEHYKYTSLKPPPPTTTRYVSHIKGELLKKAQSVPYIDSSVCTAGKVCRVLDGILKYMEISDPPRTAEDLSPLDVQCGDRTKLISKVSQLPDNAALQLSKEEEIATQLLKRGIRPDLIINWPSSLSELLDFSQQGDITECGEQLTEEDLSSGEEEEYLVTQSESEEREKLWEKCVPK